MYVRRTITKEGDSDKKISRRVQTGWINWGKLTGIGCGKKVPNRMKERIMIIVVQPGMLYGMETLPTTWG